MVLDFHALRHTCGAWLAHNSVQPTTVQSQMRHGAFAITFDTYGHSYPGAEVEAARMMGGLTSVTLVPPAALDVADEGNAGTTKLDAYLDCGPQHAQQSSCENLPDAATDDDNDDPPPSPPGGGKNGNRREKTRIKIAPTAPIAARYNTGLPLAPLAQSAEQLTLNQ
ncbi:MAG: hypothetical protein CMJ58_10350 [Planctomycetaceae bacterium]|nr:hypothetical protein [Planctomycetaceae bacterium]